MKVVAGWRDESVLDNVTPAKTSKPEKASPAEFRAAKNADINNAVVHQDMIKPCRMPFASSVGLMTYIFPSKGRSAFPTMTCTMIMDRQPPE